MKILREGEKYSVWYQLSNDRIQKNIYMNIKYFYVNCNKWTHLTSSQWIVQSASLDSFLSFTRQEHVLLVWGRTNWSYCSSKPTEKV